MLRCPAGVHPRLSLACRIPDVPGRGRSDDDIGCHCHDHRIYPGRQESESDEHRHALCRSRYSNRAYHRGNPDPVPLLALDLSRQRADRDLCSLLLGAKVIPESQPQATSGTFDKAGSGLVFVGLASLVFVVSEGATLGWTSPVIIGVALLAAVTLLWFVRNELLTPNPILDIGLFRNRNFFLANLLLFLVFFSYSGINYLLPFYLEYVHSYNTSTAGMIMTSLSFTMMIAGLVAGVSYNRIGPRRLCILAAIPLILGYVMMTRLAFHTSTGFVVIALALIGLGLGLIVTPATTMVMMSVARGRAGMVSSLTSLERNAPSPIGIATFNAIFIAGAILIAKNYDVTKISPAGLKMETLSAGFDLAFILSVVLGVVILIIAIAIKEEIHPDYAEAGKAMR